ncbi:Protein YciN [Vibrio stylophorae]|uniref:Protein YciN n=1 Tax=Vibrio stylophorae TaxID=659351 RepID=A0ABM8ZRS3_9VIBR|nr:DUF2498 family protein [Vibrio stylophorae]CAH0532992.1 Protein YciN [Vibrio stylophorae]
MSDKQEKSEISQLDLLMIANQMLQDHDAYIDGVRATEVREQAGVLIFKGEEYFLSEQGLPTEKTTTVFNLYKYLAHQLSDKFILID